MTTSSSATTEIPTASKECVDIRSILIARFSAFIMITACCCFFVGCDGPQSIFVNGGKGAERIATLFWWMTGGAIVIWVVVVGLSIYALRIRPESHDHRKTILWIVGGGAIGPTVILTVLLIFGLSILPPLLARPPEGSRQIEVEGLQWWWRVRYIEGEDEPIELANEIRLPVGEPVEFLLSSPDVVHSFWIPSLGGKVDMLPGRITRLTLEPTKVGRYRGVCAEYCGSSHALMNFSVEVMEKDAFNSWLADQRSEAHEADTPTIAEGQRLFLKSGCSACHTIRGTEADGVVGPDLTHVGSRNGLGADMLPNDIKSFKKWISQVESIKPGAKMPSFHILTDDELAAISHYLESLN